MSIPHLLIVLVIAVRGGGKQQAFTSALIENLVNDLFEPLFGVSFLDAADTADTTFGKLGHLASNAWPNSHRSSSAPLRPSNLIRKPFSSTGNHHHQHLRVRAVAAAGRDISAMSTVTAPRASSEVPISTSVDVDVAVIGGGPAGSAMAALLHATHGHKVAIVDPSPERAWPNNYGSWRVEWEALAKRLDMPELLTDGVANEWPVTDCYFGGSWGMEWDQRTRLDRAYLQVNRTGLKAAFFAKFGTGVTVLPTSIQARPIAPDLFDDNLVHDSDGSTLTLKDGTSVRAKIVVDATGFASKLVAREPDALAGLSQPLPPGYQIAYGFLCDIKGDSIAPYDNGAMTLFDYRTDHFEAAVASANGVAAKAAAEAALRDAESRPSFTYVMPYGPTGDGHFRAFFEETSLVGRGERQLDFSTLKQRALLRLKHLGLSIREGSVREEEYCYIPMGGNLPDLSQRIITVGGAAAMVHPSTGYSLCRTLTSVTDVAVAISAGLRNGASPKVIATAAYRALWSPQRRYERDFQVFGGEFLGDQPVGNLRGFFMAFFELDPREWGGFLAGWPGLPGNEYHDEWNKRFMFCLRLFKKFIKFQPEVAQAMVMYVVTFSLKYGNNFLRSILTPLFGASGGFVTLDGDGGDAGNAGVDTAKKEKSDYFADRRDAKDSGHNHLQNESLIKSRPFRKLGSFVAHAQVERVAGMGPPHDLDNPKSPGSLTDDRDWIRFQEGKKFSDQPLLTASLPPLTPGCEVDVIVAGVGPSGIALAGELAKRGLEVGLVGPDMPFTNNYGVWVDEFEQLGLTHTLLDSYSDAIYVTDSESGAQPMGRRYGRVGRKELRDELLARCQHIPSKGKVRYYAGMVKRVDSRRDGKDCVVLASGERFYAKVVVMSTGHNKDIIQFSEGPPPLWQTAYGIEVEMENHPWHTDKAMFMDLTQSDPETDKEQRIPSFLYVLPSKNKVFLEETCLVSKVQVPFDELKRRLYRRLTNLNISIPQSAIIEEEASWIPLGGALPKTPQHILAFGAAAGLVHPASGYSIVHSLQKASPVADIIAADLQNPLLTPNRRTERAWAYLWSAENRRKVAFYQFGSELIAKLPVDTLQEFMKVFYALPPTWWQGFLSSELPSPMLVPLALTMWMIGNTDLKFALLGELFTPSGVRMFQVATSPVLEREDDQDSNVAPIKTVKQTPLHDVFRRDQLRGRAPAGLLVRAQTDRFDR